MVTKKLLGKVGVAVKKAREAERRNGIETNSSTDHQTICNNQPVRKFLAANCEFRAVILRA